MKPKVILFNTAMVRALLDRRKTMTRRVMKLQPVKGVYSPYGCADGRVAFRVGERGCTDQYKPPYRPRDILYVRETWAEMPYGYVYYADGEEPEGWDADDRWYPSLHMPREAARIFLRVTDVRVERLQDITMTDMKKEGVVPESVTGGQWQQWGQEYMRPAWDSTIKKADLPHYGWDANPWVWAISFEQISKEVANNA